MKKVVFTFDDGVESHYTRVAPLFEEHRMAATFFVTGQKDLWRRPGVGTHPEQAETIMGWSEIRSLDEAGFEIGNHTWDHPGGFRKGFRKGDCKDWYVDIKSAIYQLVRLNEEFSREGISAPSTFSYPGYEITSLLVDALTQMSFSFARAGYAPGLDSRVLYLEDVSETSYYIPGVTNPLLVPCTGVFGFFPHVENVYTFERFVSDMRRMPDDNVAVFNNHGVSFDKLFDELAAVVEHVAKEGYETICLRDLPVK